MIARKQELISKAAGLAYPIRDGVPIMLPGEARELTDAEARAQMSDAWPSELRLSPAKDALTIAFDSGDSFTLSAEYLRVESPSAEVQGHTPDQKKTVPGKRHVTILSLEPVGNYAVRIGFDDGHDTGLYAWDYLHKLGRDHAKIWAGYLDALTKQGLSRG